jgi:glycosyltransferase involved in cell wall biosynthesis
LRVALLTPRFPYPPDRGDRLTAHYLVRSLFAAGHHVVVITFTDGNEPPEARDRLGAICGRLETVHLSRARSWLQAWRGLLSLEPSQVWYYRSNEMMNLVRTVLDEERVEAVYCHTMRMAPFLVGLGQVGVVSGLGDSLGLALRRSVPYEPLWKWPGIGWEQWRVDRFEARISRRFHETWAYSPVDSRDLERIGCRNVKWVPLGVDDGLFQVERRADVRPTIVFLGNLSVPHNVDAARFAARRVFPRVRREHPQARLLLAGANAVAPVRRLAALPGVEVTSPVPDLRRLWEASHVLLAPLRFSTGIQFKVLEAMAAGVPVVTTLAVAEGIGARDEEHLLVADDSTSLAAAVVRALREGEAAAARAERGREYVRQTFAWSTSVRNLERVALEAKAAIGAVPP